MKLYINGKESDGQGALSAEDIAICICAPPQAQQVLQSFGIEDEGEHAVSSEAVAVHGATRHESHLGYDFINISIPDMDEPEQICSWIGIYLAANRLLIVDGGAPAVDEIIAEIEKRQLTMTPAAVLHMFFSYHNSGQAESLKMVEQEIADLEDRVLMKHAHDCTAEISEQRRRTLTLKRYYQGLVDMHEDLEENQNQLLNKEELRLMHLQTNRAERLYHNVLSLNEYVTQVREAYQNQLDISLNETMRLFTVITSIFLPLSLIAGWYGMNLQMPEYLNPYAYPIIILLSIILAIILLWYFKRKKWF